MQFNSNDGSICRITGVRSLSPKFTPEFIVGTSLCSVALRLSNKRFTSSSPDALAGIAGGWMKADCGLVGRDELDTGRAAPFPPSNDPLLERTTLETPSCEFGAENMLRLVERA